MKLENSLLCNAVYFSAFSSAISVAQARSALRLVRAAEVTFGLRTENMKLDKQEEYCNIILTVYFSICGPGSSVGIVNVYGLDGPGSNPGGDEIFRLSRPALGPTKPPLKWVRGFPRGVKCGRGMLLTTQTLLVPRSWKSRAIPLPTLWATPGL